MEILFRDEHLVVVNKPSGLLVHRSPIDRHETRFALQMTRNLIGQPVYPVHRLDKPTSGALLFALSPEIARTLASAFGSRQVGKRYLAVVRGVVPEDGCIEHSLSDESDRYDPLSPETSEAERMSVTEYRRLATAELPLAAGRYSSSRYSLVDIHPRTGRRHQIRRHFKHVSHPIIGDVNYGDGRHNRLFRAEFGCSRLLLAAVELTFPHPVTGAQVIVTAPLDAAFFSLLDRLDWSGAVPEEWLPGQKIR